MSSIKITLAAWMLAHAATVMAADLVVIVNPAAPPLTKEKAGDIFLGKEPTYAPVDYSDAAPLKAEFYKKISGRDLTQVKTTWTRIVFTGKGAPPKEVQDASAVKKMVAANPQAVGYIEKSALDSTVKAALVLE
ncbi:hypothetical protein [Ideonella sp.]|uniref:hypothetical protein n=1 Tax=Ideonella sp. TaxID=1929293 RepID=UPI003BB7C50E